MQKVKRILALLLIMAFAITQLPVTALAENMVQDEIGIETTEKAEASSRVSLQSMPADPATTVGIWALEKLAGGIVSGIAGKGVNEAFAAIFGSDTAQILQALQEIKGQLDNIESQIKDMSGKLEEGELKRNLDSFAEFFSDYASPYNQLCGYQKDLAEEGELTDLFMQDLYWGKNRNIDTGSKTVIAASNALGNRITMVLTSGYNVFGAFDQLERHQNRWEHQGYEKRKEYRNYIITVYAMYNAMGQTACEKVIEAHQGDDLRESNIRMQAQRDLDELKANAEKVKNMYQRCAVIEHSNLRIYRDTTSGTNLFAFYNYFSKSYVQNWPEGSDREGMLSDDFMYTLTHSYEMPRYYANGGIELFSDQPWRGDFQKIHADYKKDNNGQAISLYHIFFDKDKGNFENYTDLPSGTRFATDYYFCTLKYDKHNVYYLYTNVVTNDAQLEESVRLLRLSKYRFSDVTDEAFFSLSKYTGNLYQGALKSPLLPPASATAGMISGMESSYELPYSGRVTLSMQEKAGATYQWYVARGEGNDFEEITGETGATYTLPGLEPAMNGWMYRCAIIENAGTEEEISTLADPETLKLTGEGVPEPVTIHETGSAPELTAALEKVADGTWDGHALKLTANINYSLPITLIGSNVIIDLNGHTLTVQPDPTSAPNVSPMSNTAAMAAIYADNFSRLKLTGAGALNVVAGEGVAYGVYAGEGSNVQVNAVTSAGAGKAVYTAGNGTVTADSITVAGDNSYGLECFGSGSIIVSGDVTVTGVSSYGAYIDSDSGGVQPVFIGGDVVVTGEKSRGAYLGAEEAILSIAGNVTVTGGACGVAAGKGEVVIRGDISAPDYAVDAWQGASLTVHGNVVAGGKEATAVSSSGADVHIQGNVTSSGQDGTGIYASAWELADPTRGATVTVDGQIRAVTPLRMGSLPIEESEHLATTTKQDYYTFTDTTNTVWTKPGSFQKLVIHTVTFDKNGANTEASPNFQDVIAGGQLGPLPTAPGRAGYIFMGWNTEANGSGTTFTADTAITASITVYAQWSRNSSGGGRGSAATVGPPKTETNLSGHSATVATTVTATLDSRGTAAAAVSSVQISEAINKAKAEAQKQGAGTAARVEIQVQAPAAATTAATSIPPGAIGQAVQAGLGALTISTPVASLSFDNHALNDLSRQTSGDMKISASRVDAATLPPAARQTVGDRPVFDFRVESGGQSISQFGGEVSVSVPYTLQAGEDANAIIIYFVNNTGELEIVSNGLYDPTTGRVSFSTRHFSRYAVGYHLVSFKDVAENAWYGQAVGFIAARAITTGTGEGYFSPQAKLTRGQFIVMLMNAYGLAAAADPRDNFADAGATYYTDYLAAAKHLNIANGVGDNRFAPEREITRQEMFTLLANALQGLNKMPPATSGKTLTSFTDREEIAPWAQPAMQLLVETGTISGDGNQLLPTSTTTRAEMAQVLFNLLTQ